MLRRRNNYKRMFKCLIKIIMCYMETQSEKHRAEYKKAVAEIKRLEHYEKMSKKKTTEKD